MAMTNAPLGRAFHGGLHYENFPVASWLIPASHRPAVVQLYRFARTGDDLADEGNLTMQERLEGLRQLREGLWRPLDNIPRPSIGFEIKVDSLATLGQQTAALFQGYPQGRGWADLLLQAFEYDAQFSPFEDWSAVMAYCRKSAQPVGRIMLGLFGLWSDPQTPPPPSDREPSIEETVWAESDAICTGLQLINFAQDLHEDLGRHRPTVPRSQWPKAWSWQPSGPDQAEIRHGFLQGETTPEEQIEITRALTLRGLNQLARGRDLPKRLEQMKIAHGRRLAFEIAITLEGGQTIGERMLKNPRLPWKASTQLSKFWLMLILVNRLPRMFFKTPF